MTVAPQIIKRADLIRAVESLGISTEDVQSITINIRDIQVARAVLDSDGEMQLNADLDAVLTKTETIKIEGASAEERS